MADISKRIRTLYDERKRIQKAIEGEGIFSEKQEQFLRFNEIEQEILDLRNKEQFEDETNELLHFVRMDENGFPHEKIATFLRQFALRLVSRANPHLTEEQVFDLVDTL